VRDSVEAFDLILLRRGDYARALGISISASQRLYTRGEHILAGTLYRSLKPFADWLAVSNEKGQVASLDFTCVVDQSVVDSSLFQARNVLRRGEDFRVVLTRSDCTSVEGWPLSTVYSLRGGEGELALYIPQFFVQGQTVDIAPGLVEDHLPG